MEVVDIHAMHFARDQYGGSDRVLDNPSGLYLRPCIMRTKDELPPSVWAPSASRVTLHLGITACREIKLKRSLGTYETSDSFT